MKKIREEMDTVQWKVELDADTVDRAWTRFKNLLKVLDNPEKV